MEFPKDLRYTDTHEYIQANDAEESWVVGITAFAVDQLGDIVFVDLPAVGRTVSPGEVMVTVESVKAVGEVYAPVAGTVTAVNSALTDAPETLAEAPYTNGWLVKITPTNTPAPDAFMDAETYCQQVGA
ncbi:MAG TPA: glycine cleavage system protein GcvH [Cyanobacteria bacterium UBA8156]|jgi:glycine cleavage system H protein|nr:glycine cleavage system protein GcvH [Cyanobacteria bacterium UBA8156]